MAARRRTGWIGYIGVAVALLAILSGLVTALGFIFVTKAEASAHAGLAGHPVMVERVDHIQEQLKEINANVKTIGVSIGALSKEH